MKKILVVMLVIIMACTVLAGCGNENWGIGTYTYTHVHINDADGYCATVNSWHDNELGIELHTQEFGNVYCSEGTYLLFGDGSKCPYCNEG